MSKQPPIDIVCTYTDPDLDGVSSATAYAHYLTAKGRRTEAVFIGTPTVEARWVAEHLNVKLHGLPHGRPIGNIIVVDASDQNWLFTDLDPQKVTEVIDHRKTSEQTPFPNAVMQNELVGAAATLIAEKYMCTPEVDSARDHNPDISNGIKITKQDAALLYAAIASNTLNFRASTMTHRDRDAAVWLKDRMLLPRSFVHDMFAAKSDLSGIKLNQSLENEYATFTFGDVKLLFCQLEMIGARELVASRKRDILEEIFRLKKQTGADTAFLSILDVEEGINIFVAADFAVQNVLSAMLGAHFKDGIAESDAFLMRKEIAPLLKEFIESNKIV